MGTLFERGLDPSKRSQLGAHYTDPEKIMMIVRPVIIEPLTREWDGVKAQIESLIDKAPKPTQDKLLRGADLAARTRALNKAEELHRAFIERLKAFRVLDPACGSGNFLFLSLKALKDIEHRVNTECEALGLPRGFPTVGPEAMLGIEINPFAAELARVSVWIGEIQWMRDHGFNAARDPILKPLETIRCHDALLDDDGGEYEWPKADVIVGNPPFLGGKRLRDVLGDNTVDRLFRVYEGRVPAEADLVCYWFAKAFESRKTRRDETRRDETRRDETRRLYHIAPGWSAPIRSEAAPIAAYLQQYKRPAGFSRRGATSHGSSMARRCASPSSVSMAAVRASRGWMERRSHKSIPIYRLPRLTSRARLG
jgi:type II restriction/modification system DNA methylase subunit YeeA